MIRPIDLLTDYSTICKWWQTQGHPIIPAHVLPVNGALALEDDEPVAAAWVYLTDSSIAWLEWYVADPGCGKIIRRQALGDLSDYLIEIAKNAGKTVIYSCIQLDSMKDLAERKGFIETNRNCSVYFKNI